MPKLTHSALVAVHPRRVNGAAGDLEQGAGACENGDPTLRQAETGVVMSVLISDAAGARMRPLTLRLRH